MLPDDIVDTLFALHERWQMQVVGIETTAFQRILVRDVARRLDEERKKRPNYRLFRIEEFTGVSSKSKEQRIMGLQPYHERGALKFPGERLELLSGHYQTLAYQLLQFPRSPHDDYADSLAYHVPLHRKGTITTPKQDLPEFCIARIEQQAHAQAVETWRSTPRWARQPVTQPLFQ